MNGIVLRKSFMPFNYIQTAKTYITELMMTVVMGLVGIITLDQLPLLVSVLGAIGTVIILPWYFGFRRYKHKEEQEHEKHVALMIKELKGTIIKETDSEEEIQRKVLDFINNVNKKTSKDVKSHSNKRVP